MLISKGVFKHCWWVMTKQHIETMLGVNVVPLYPCIYHNITRTVRQIEMDLKIDRKINTCKFLNDKLTWLSQWMVDLKLIGVWQVNMLVLHSTDWSIPAMNLAHLYVFIIASHINIVTQNGNASIDTGL